MSQGQCLTKRAVFGSIFHLFIFPKNTQVLHYRSTSGTTHLRDHLTHCSENPVNQHSQKATTSRPITAFFKSTQKLSQLDKKKLLDASVTFIAKDIRPFKAIEDHGFKNMAKCLVQLGAKYGNFDVNEALPSRHTVKRHAVQQADVKQNQIIDHLQSAIKANGYVGLTTDMWTDYNSRSYLSLTLHFVVDGVLHHCVVAVNHYVSDTKSGKNIRDAIVKFFEERQVTLDVLTKHTIFVTDNGSNMVLALNGFKRIPCACHLLATVLVHTLQVKSLSKSCFPLDVDDPSLLLVNEIKSNISAVKSITTYFKQSGLNKKLKKSLKQSNETRWNTVLYMLKSYVENRDDVEMILNLRRQGHMLLDVDMLIISDLIKFLEPFEEATKSLEGDLLPTLHKVYLCFSKLKQTMAKVATDSNVLAFLKERGLQCLQEKFTISDFHLLALFVNPKFKSLRSPELSNDNRKRVHDLARSLMSEIVSSPSVGSVDEEHSYGQPSKKSKAAALEDEFFDWQCDTEVAQKEDEVTEYLAMVFSNQSVLNECVKENEFNILQFWNNPTIKSQFPTLSHMALGILSVPASSAASERAFSTSGNILEVKCRSLSATAVSSLMVLHSTSQGTMKNLLE